MRKHGSFFVWLLISLLLLTACGQTTAPMDLEPTPYEKINNLDGVTMTIKAEASPTGLTVEMENNSDKDCIYGEYFWLEKKIEGEWYELPVVIEGNYGFNDIGYDLPSGAASQWTVDWEGLYGSLEQGEYRIVKDILVFRGTGDYDTYYMAVEFYI
jgi:hypothetical protein